MALCILRKFCVNFITFLTGEYLYLNLLYISNGLRIDLDSPP